MLLLQKAFAFLDRVYGQLKNGEKNYFGLNGIRKVKSVVLNVRLFSGINVSRRQNLRFVITL